MKLAAQVTDAIVLVIFCSIMTILFFTILKKTVGMRSDGDAALVTADVSGTFPGSPIQLRFRFVTDGERIRELRIG